LTGVYGPHVHALAGDHGKSNHMPPNLFRLPWQYLSAQMTDVLTKEQRSLNMSHVRSRDTKPELVIRRLLRKNGIRNYRVTSSLPGKPDMVFGRAKVAVFIDDCYWHMCPLHFKEPGTRKKFWMAKIQRNVIRDRIVTDALQSAGWHVMRFWEHDVRESPDGVVNLLMAELRQH